MNPFQNSTGLAKRPPNGRGAAGNWLFPQPRRDGITPASGRCPTAIDFRNFGPSAAWRGVESVGEQRPLRPRWGGGVNMLAEYRSYRRAAPQPPAILRSSLGDAGRGETGVCESLCQWPWGNARGSGQGVPRHEWSPQTTLPEGCRRTAFHRRRPTHARGRTRWSRKWRRRSMNSSPEGGGFRKLA